MTTNYEISKVVEPYTDCVILTHISAHSLRKLVRKAQQNDPQALDRLCSLYVPVVRSIYTDSIVKFILGEDAIDIVWELFLRFVKTYQGNNFKYFPGLVKACLMRRIKNTLRKPGMYKALVSPDSEALVNTPKEDKALAKVNANYGFYKLLEGCSKRQVKIAELLYMYNLDQEYVAKVMHCNKRNLRKAIVILHTKVKANYYKQHPQHL